jgi:hypothetical protein
MEKLGVPTAVINTEPFVGSSKGMAVAHGIPDYPFIVIPHPIAATEKKVLQDWANQIVNQVVAILTGQDIMVSKS